MIKIPKIVSVLKLSVLLLSLITASSYAVDCSSVPLDPAGNVAKLKDALQQATNTGKPLTITGRYQISQDLKVYLKRDLIVDATGATFIATENLDGDMFSLDSHVSKSNECNSADLLANIHWNGGNFNMASAKVSTVVPITSKTPAEKQGTQATADALSIRGYVKGTSADDFWLKVNEVTIENITITGTENNTDNLFLAGGDSGILMTGATKATIKNNKFYGIRDAAVYLSAGGPNPSQGGTDGRWGGDFLIENNYAERTYDAFTSKRGANNVIMRGNTIVDAVVGLSIKQVYDGWHADTVTISNNTIDKSVRPISIEKASDVTITNNAITGLGDKVANQDTAINAMNPNQYDGIGLYGVDGTNIVKNNSITAVSGKETVGITTSSLSKYSDLVSKGVTFTDNVLINLKTDMDLVNGTETPDPSFTPQLEFTEKPTELIADYSTISIAISATSPSEQRTFTLALYLNDTLVREDNSAPFVWDQTTDTSLLGLPVGEHKIKAIVTDSRGDMAEIQANFRVSRSVITPTPEPQPEPEQPKTEEPKAEQPKPEEPKPSSGGSGGGAIAWLLLSLLSCRLLRSQ